MPEREYDYHRERTVSDGRSDGSITDSLRGVLTVDLSLEDAKQEVLKERYRVKKRKVK